MNPLLIQPKFSQRPMPALVRPTSPSNNADNHLADPRAYFRFRGLLPKVSKNIDNIQIAGGCKMGGSHSQSADS